MCLLFKLYFIYLFGENYAFKDNMNKKNLLFMENLKHDLRRNNDDYADMRQNILQTNTTQQKLDHINLNDIRYKIITTRDDKKVIKSDQNNNKTAPNRRHNNNDKEDVRIKLIDNIRRRVNDALISKETIINDDNIPQRRAGNDKHKASKRDGTLLDNNRPTLRSISNDIHNQLQKKDDMVNRYRMRLLSNKTNTNGLPHMFTLRTIQTTNLKKNKKLVKKRKMEKFKNFIQKNNGLLREFISSKKQAGSMSIATPATQQTFAQHKPNTISGRELNKVMQQVVDGTNRKNIVEELPNAAMLDMFPAKGGRIHAKRVKGHLCHRHVLIPEGPKYSSLGRIYLPPHAAAHIAHEYNATELPKLLLPRCCNCCHKSVLGCE